MMMYRIVQVVHNGPAIPLNEPIVTVVSQLDTAHDVMKELTGIYKFTQNLCVDTLHEDQYYRGLAGSWLARYMREHPGV